jgi:hypothetical protein
MLVFFTPAGIKSYTTNFPDYMDRNVVIAAMGQTTLEAAAKAGLKVDVTITPETPSMASAIEQYLKKAKNHDDKSSAKAAKAAPAAKKTATATAKPEVDEAAAAKRSAAAKKAAATRKAKAEAEKAAAAKRSAAAKKAAATRKAKAEAAKTK